MTVILQAFGFLREERPLDAVSKMGIGRQQRGFMRNLRFVVVLYAISIVLCPVYGRAVRIALSPDMVVNENSVGDPRLLVDEQAGSDIPRGGTPVT